MRALLAIAAASGAAFAAQEGEDTGTLLAEIPSDLEVSNVLVPTSSRGTFNQRSSLVWSTDGTRVAYAGIRGGRSGAWVPVVGNEIGEPYDHVRRPILAGGHAIFVVGRSLTVSHENQWIWIDGETIGPEDWLGPIAVDAEGEQIAYWAQPGARVGNAEPSKSYDEYRSLVREKRSGVWSVSRPKDTYLGEALVAPLFTEDGRKVFAFSIRKGGGWVVVERSGSRVKELTDKSPHIVNLAIAANGKAFAYTAQESRDTPAEVFFKKKSVGHTHPDQHSLALDQRGKHVAYVANARGRATAAVGAEDEPRGAYDHVLELAFDPDGQRLAFVANVGGRASDTPGLVDGGEAFVVVRPTSGDGEWAEEARFQEVRDIVWSEDGARLAYGARTEAGWVLVCGDSRSDAYDDVGVPVFTPDGSAVGFGARKQRELWWKLVPLD